ncbi:cell wall anchor protein [Rhizobium sp. PL01]|uniref:cell wall anchor protein n=1 Tax=Rhizobium sp. PL01 TaxID=3085631 RepID=UPI002981D3B6|nr:cell wall anchor protein [Rhizobium sp. PL01]MDW5318359.1 cell wall anchor protein [Rhizobium sp. PL01]
MAVARLALSACTTTSIDTAIQTNLPKAGQIVETAHVAFPAVAATGKVKARTVAKVEAAYGGVAIICVNPAGVTVADALGKLQEGVTLLRIDVQDEKRMAHESRAVIHQRLDNRKRCERPTF